MEMPELLRQIYRLKHLKTIGDVTADILRDCVGELSARSWKGNSGKYTDTFYSHGSRAVSTVIRELANMEFDRDPAGATGLQELELDRWDFDSVAKSLHDSFEKASWFLLNAYQDIFAANEPVDWLRQEKVLSFSYGGVNIYLPWAPVWLHKGHVTWLEMTQYSKSLAAASGSDEWRRYRIFRTYKTDPGRINIHFYDIFTGNTYCRDSADFDFTRAREVMYKEAAVMMDWVQEAVSAEFDVMESMPEPDRDCSKCRFREFCRRYGSVNL